MTSTLKSQVLTTLFLSLMATLPAQAASRVVVNGDFENMGDAPYHAKLNALTHVNPVPGYGWQTTDSQGKIEVWNHYVDNRKHFPGYGGRGFLLKRMRTVLDFYISQFVCVKENR
jgi:hypothetical protein